MQERAVRHVDFDHHSQFSTLTLQAHCHSHPSSPLTLTRHPPLPLSLSPPTLILFLTLHSHPGLSVSLSCQILCQDVLVFALLLRRQWSWKGLDVPAGKTRIGGGGAGNGTGFHCRHVVR